MIAARLNLGLEKPLKTVETRKPHFVWRSRHQHKKNSPTTNATELLREIRKLELLMFQYQNFTRPLSRVRSL